MKKIPAKRVIAHFDGGTNLARILNERGYRISRQAIEKWQFIPAKRAKLIALLSNGVFTCSQLRPDIFGDSQ